MQNEAINTNTDRNMPKNKKVHDYQPLVTSPESWRQQDLNEPSLFINRELSQIAFNRRVLELALDPSVPLLERVKFLCISCTNLDEFFEVRVAGVRQRIKLDVPLVSADGLTPQATLHHIRLEAVQLVNDQYQVFNDVLLDELAREDICILRRKDWSKKQRTWLHKHFERELMPVLSPLGLDPVHPFPRILNKSLNFAVELEGRDAFGRDTDMALVRAPRSLPRIIRIPPSYAKAQYEFVFLSAILHDFMDELFPGMRVDGCYQFRVTRNSELFVDEEEIEDLARALQGELQERAYAEAVRLEIINDCPDNVEKFLVRKFDLDPTEVYHCDGPVNLNRLSEIFTLVDRPDLKYRQFSAHIPLAMREEASIFEAIRRRDYVLHHPYDSFRPVVEMLHQASVDPDVLAIKQTLYRTGVDSVMVNSLIEAARNGKDVTVVVELRARFDEQANITLANRLQEAGVQVVYGIVGHKTHAKMLLIVRRERGRLHRYVHLGTGNYHQGTARAYTDWCLLTNHRGIAEDVHLIFQQLSGLGKVQKLSHILQSPFTLHKSLLAKIQREAEHAKAGKAALIQAKMNALTEPRIIRALYRASRAGVKIQLIIRGPCCLRPGIKGLSENIEVRSILGRFLEHSRLFYFLNDGDSELYGSSADWMERNLFHRVEASFPILRSADAQRIREDSLELPFHEDIQAWELHRDGSYAKRGDCDSHSDDDDAKIGLLHAQEQLLRRHHGH